MFLITLTYSNGNVLTYSRNTIKGVNVFLDQVVKGDLVVLEKVEIERIKP